MSLISPVYGNLLYRPMEKGRKLYNKHPEKPLPKPEQGVVWLRVPFDDKEKAKKLGARWNPELKFWYAKQGTNLARFSRWIPKGSTTR